MHATCLLDDAGRIPWSNYFLPEFPAAVCHSLPLWELSVGGHAERLRQDFALVRALGETRRGIYGFVSPVTGGSVDVEAEFEACPGAEVVCTWRKAQAVIMVSPVEARILALVCADYSNRQIADALGYSESTISGYRKAIRERFNRQGTAGEVMLALELGLVQPPERRGA